MGCQYISQPSYSIFCAWQRKLYFCRLEWRKWVEIRNKFFNWENQKYVTEGEQFITMKTQWLNWLGHHHKLFIWSLTNTTYQICPWNTTCLGKEFPADYGKGNLALAVAVQLHSHNRSRTSKTRCLLLLFVQHYMFRPNWASSYA